MSQSNALPGHLAALFTVAVWGTTFVATKTLLTTFHPVEILFFRFVLGYLALLLFRPRFLGKLPAKQELTYAAAGLCGVTLYFLFENIALTYTLASNVGTIVAVAPLFTALLSWKFLGGEAPTPRFFVGFVVAIAGVALVSWGGGPVTLDWRGDGLALLAAIVWAVYSVLLRKIESFGHDNILTTRRVFFYGLLLMVPALFFLDFRPDSITLMTPALGAGLLYLGLGASAVCFVSWSFAVRRLGPVATSVYMYLVPLVTVAASALVLSERPTPTALLGMVLILAGLIWSQKRT